MDTITITISTANAQKVIERTGGWQDSEGRWHFGGGAAEHVGPYPQLDEALTVAVASIAAGGALDA